jgi:Kef-type K+ transport system membrane component KefB
MEIVCSLVIGAIVGAVISVVPKIFKSRDNRLIAAIMAVFLCIGVCELFAHLEHSGVLPFKLSDLLVCMMAGAIFVNVSDQSPRVMEGVDRWTPVLFMVFFILSGAELDVTKLLDWKVLLILALYLVARSAGKYFGGRGSCKLSHCTPAVTKHLGITLLPQAGVALGMALTAAALADGALVRNVVLFSVLVYELVGPALTKRSLLLAGEIRVEGKTSSRVTDTPREHISIH